MKFIYAAKNKNGKYFVKYSDDSGAEVFASTSDKVVEYANKILKQGDEFDAQLTKQGTFVKMGMITKKGEVAAAKPYIPPVAKPTMETGVIPPKTFTSTTGTSAFKCSDCGKDLKDGTYTKCFTCNQKAPVSSPSEAERKNKLGVMSLAAQSVATAFQGQLADVETLAGKIEDLFDRLYKKIG